MYKRDYSLPKRFWKDNQWIINHYDKLSRKYADKWIAVLNSKVVASGESIGGVEKIAEEKTGKKYIPVMFIEKGVHIYGICVRI